MEQRKDPEKAYSQILIKLGARDMPLLKLDFSTHIARSDYYGHRILTNINYKAYEQNKINYPKFEKEIEKNIFKIL